MLNATLPTINATTLDGIDREFYADSFIRRWDSENTRATYRDDLKVFFGWCDGHGLDVFAAHRTHLEIFVRYLAEERGNAISTIHHRMATLRQFYELALDDDLVRKNPCRLVKLPRIQIDNTRAKSLTAREFDRLVDVAAASTPTDYALTLVMGICGLRVSAACSLDVETSTVVEQAHRVFLFTQKGGQVTTVPQPPMVIQAVDRAIDGRTTGPLLRRRDGSRMTRSSAARVVKRLAKKAGINRSISPHTLRHTFCEASLNANVPLEIVAKSMGHKDSSTTYRHYSRRGLPSNMHSSYVVAGKMLVPSF
ncbi:hypothetical protein CH302_23670 [Rhodococcus sp. 15-2388-1-1a]|uniref:tyrosine-type recombinase/integrase n=1 Tax=Nocardiaceae TaxID=85025 RepID=UPI000567CF18|nr:MULTISPECIES: tyrosine-type recombinase/integrase [Rhodococcus]OZE92115.1 hypothetical protein CH302_23670 [Rhodococcus sp. 15-2388-1-1a]